MYQKILKLKYGQSFKGHAMEVYHQADIMHVHQSYFGLHVADKIRTKDRDVNFTPKFTKVIYKHFKMPKYIGKQMKRITKSPEKALLFQIQFENRGTNVKQDIHVNPYYNQIEVHSTLTSEDHVCFTNHGQNISYGSDCKRVLSYIKSMLNDEDVVLYLSNQINDYNRKTDWSDKKNLFAEDKSIINLLYLIKKYNLNVNDFIVADSLNPEDNIKGY